MTTRLYTVRLRGGSNDFSGGIAVDMVGNAVVTGFTDSTDFPVTRGAFQATNAGGMDAFLVKVALGKRHQGSGHRTASVTPAGGSGARAGLTRDRMTGRR